MGARMILVSDYNHDNPLRCFDLLRVDQAEFWTLNIAIFTGDSGILRFQTTVSKHHITLPFACNLLIFLKSIT